MPKIPFLAVILTAFTWMLVGAPRASAQESPDAWRTQLDAGLNLSRGNTDLVTFLGGVGVRRLETESLEFQFSVNYRYGKSDDRVLQDLLRQDIKVDFQPRDAWSPFLFQSATRNPVRRVKLRTNGGAGAKYTFWKGERGKSSVSWAGIFNFEDLDALEGQEAPETEKTLRWSGRWKFDYEFPGGSTVQQVLFYQPVWNEFGDYYVTLTHTLTTQLVGDLRLTVSHEYNHDETPPEGIVKDDTFLAVGFRYVF